MTSGQIVGKMDTQKQLNVPLEGAPRDARGGEAHARAGGTEGKSPPGPVPLRRGVLAPPAPGPLQPHARAHAAPAHAAGAEEVINTPFCPLQEKFHTFVLRGLRNISEAP